MEQTDLFRFVELLGGENSEKLCSLLRLYSDELYRVGKTMNLTGYNSPESLRNDLILSSISPLCNARVPRGTRVADLGSGQGIPGIPLSIVRPDWNFSLFEVREKRISFLSHIIRLLDVSCCVEEGRVEAAAHEERLRGRFGLVVSRAFAPLPVTLECGAPLLEDNGLLYVYSEERNRGDAFRLFVKDLGLAEADEKEINAFSVSREGLLFQKKAATPEKYPRRFAAMKRNAEKLMGAGADGR